MKGIELPPYLPARETKDAILVNIFVQPRSSRNKISGIHGDDLKINLTAPPVGGAANRMCIKFFAKSLGWPKSFIEIKSGHSGRRKVLKISYDGNNLSKNNKARLITRLIKFIKS